MDEILTTYSKKLNMFLSNIMIRRSGSNTFFDDVIIPLELIAVKIILCNVKKEYNASIERCAARTEQELKLDFDLRIKRWEKDGRRGAKPELIGKFTTSNAAYFLRLAADFAPTPDLHQ